MGRTALILACQHGYVHFVDLLLAAGADPNKQDAHRDGTALHWASMHGQGQCCLRLLRAGAKIDIRNSTGDTPVSVVNSMVDQKHVMVHLNSPEELEAILQDPYAPNAMYTDTVIRTVELQKCRADKIKQKGNKSFGKKQYNEALKIYEKALVEYAFECPLDTAIVYTVATEHNVIFF